MALFRSHLKIEKHRQNWEAFCPNQPMELVIPVIPSKEHRRRVFPVSKSTQFIDNEIVGNEDRQVCVVDLVSVSAESIDSDLLDIKQSSLSKAKSKGTLKEIPDIIVTKSDKKQRNTSVKFSGKVYAGKG